MNNLSASIGVHLCSLREAALKGVYIGVRHLKTIFVTALLVVRILITSIFLLKANSRLSFEKLAFSYNFHRFKVI